MKAIKKIICPVDVYEFRPEASEYAQSLAQALGAEIFAIYVMEPMPLRFTDEGYPRSPFEEEQALKQKAEAKLAELMPHFAGASQGQGKVVIGHSADKILQVAEEQGGDMIVMASFCRTLVCRAIHGSVTSRVLANSAIPVLVIYPKE